MKEMRRVLSLVLCALMLVGMLPVGAFAAEAETAEEQLIEIGSVSKAAADANDDVDFLFVATDRQENTAIIGDQLLTDIMAGKCAGLKRSFLVLPINDRTELFFRTKRKIEAPYIRKYKRLHGDKDEK